MFKYFFINKAVFEKISLFVNRLLYNLNETAIITVQKVRNVIAMKGTEQVSHSQVPTQREKL